MCYKWDKLQRLGDVRVGGCEWVAMAAGSQGTRDRRGGGGKVGGCGCERKMGVYLLAYVHFGLFDSSEYMTAESKHRLH